jgi:hypothetical protein
MNVDSFSVSFSYKASYAKVEFKPDSSREYLRRYYADLHDASADFDDIAKVAETHKLEISKTHETKRERRSASYGVPGSRPKYLGGMPPEVTTTIGNYLISIGSAAMLVTFLSGVRPLLEKWIEGHYSRTIKITADGKTVELSGTNDIEKALDAMSKLAGVASKPIHARKGIVEEFPVRTWNVFISHASEDKEAVTIPLAKALERAGLSVWLDRQELRLGDSLREKIDEGLANSQFGIVILSPSFLAKGWTRRELDGLFAVEDAAGRKVILPIWYQIDKATLARYSPILADRLAADVAHGIPSVVRDIIAAVTEPGAGALVDVALTPLRLFVDLLDRKPNQSDVVAFLSSHPRLMESTLGRVDTGLWSAKLGSVLVDFCSSKAQYTEGDVTWSLVQFQPPSETLFVGPVPSPLLMERVGELQDVRRWIGNNLREARQILPAITTGFKGIVVAGRREELSESTKEALRLYNEELPGITVRTFDWIIDAVAQRDER